VAVVATLALFGLLMGYVAATRPVGGSWKSPFSWHPFLMTIGMVSFMGIGAMTKKLGGRVNTIVHGILSWCGIACTAGGLYAIYHNKNLNGRPHMTSWHSYVGLLSAVSSVGIGLAGGIVLHPDFGMANKNATIRLAHKVGARLTLALAWMAAFSGLYNMSPDTMTLILYGFPLVACVPFALM